MNAEGLSKKEAIKMVQAKLISNILHPWAVLVPVLALAAYRVVDEPLECIMWTLIAYLPAIIFPLVYAKVRAMTLSRRGTQQKVSRSLVRNEPKQLLIMAILFGIPSALLLIYLNGPKNLLVIMLGITAVMLVIALVNRVYRASFHLAMITSMLTALYILFGPVSLVTFLIIPILGFSRYQLGEHTPVQMVAGFLVGLIVGGAIFYGFGLAP